MSEREATDIRWVSERHMRVSLGGGASEATSARVRGAHRAVTGAGIPGLIDVTPAYATLLLTFELGGLDEAGVSARVAEVIRRAAGDPAGGAARLVAIPVCYQGEYAPDIEEVARVHGMNAADVARVHCGAEYVVHFLGFSPGFAYLGGLPEGLATARLDRPRVRVPAGSVGIAGNQTGVYPHETAGGWRLIGRTPVRMFDVRRETPALLAIGDRVKFVSIDAERFRELAAEGR